jgi:hypothetical protein
MAKLPSTKLWEVKATLARYLESAVHHTDNDLTYNCDNHLNKNYSFDEGFYLDPCSNILHSASQHRPAFHLVNQPPPSHLLLLRDFAPESDSHNECAENDFCGVSDTSYTGKRVDPSSEYRTMDGHCAYNLLIDARGYSGCYSS